MPGLKVALKTGNWSDTTVWSGGAKPSAGDTVCANGFTVTIDEDINVGTLTTLAQSPVTLIPVMTGYTTPSGIVTTSGDGSPNFAWTAFNGSTSLSPAWYANNVTTGWLAYEFPSPVVVDGYGFVLRGDNYNPKTWTFEGWNGSSWVVLHTVSLSTISTTYNSGSIGNTTAYSKYRYNITSNFGATPLIVLEAYMYERLYTDFGAAGGGFVAASTATITCTSTNGIISGPTTALTVSGSSPAVVTVNANITSSNTTDNVSTLIKSGNCTLTITGNTRISVSGNNRHCVNINAAGTTNFIGGVTGFWNGSRGILMNTGSTGGVLNITGEINPTKFLDVAQNGTHLVISSVCTVNITGNIYGGYGNSIGVSIGAAASVYVTGNVYGGFNQSGGNGNAISSSVASLLSIVGIIGATHTAPNETFAVVSTSSSAINLFSGPFVSGNYGTYPFACTRMHLIPTSNSYFEFRDETTNGALSPGAVAPATRLLSPAFAADAPVPANVRFGTVYANGSLTGTCRIPAANTVAAGILVDNTTGSAVLTPTNVWDVQTSTLTTSGSLGERLKNVSTVQTTGEQLASIN